MLGEFRKKLCTSVWLQCTYRKRRLKACCEAKAKWNRRSEGSSNVSAQLAQGKSALMGSLWRGKARTKNESSALYDACRKTKNKKQAEGSYAFSNAIMSILLYVKG